MPQRYLHILTVSFAVHVAGEHWLDPRRENKPNPPILGFEGYQNKHTHIPEKRETPDFPMVHFSTLAWPKTSDEGDVLNDFRQASHPAKLISFPHSADSWAINRGRRKYGRLGRDSVGFWEDFLLQSTLQDRIFGLQFWTQLVGCLVNWLIWQAKSVVSMVREKFLEFSSYWWDYTHISKGTCREYQFILEFWCQNLCNKSSWLLSFSSSSAPKSTFSIYIYI